MIANWQTPKTDWVENDFIQVADYNRWINNLDILQGLCSHLFQYNNTSLGNEVNESNIPYADMLNAIEDTLHNINATSVNYDIGAKKTFYPNQPYIKYDEINRIESAMLRLYNELLVRVESLPRLEFTLGNYRGIRV